MPAANAAEALALAQQYADQLAQVVALETFGQEPPRWQTAVTSASQVAISRYDLNEVTLAVNLDDAGFVVLADTYYPGWRATVDGQPTAVYRANSVVRAVYVPAGSHTIVFTFWPWDFVAGTAVSAAALLVGLFLLAWGWRRRQI